MSIGKGVTKTYTATATANTTADKLTVPIVKPANVQRWGVINANGTDIAASGAFALDKRVDAGTNTGRVELDTLSPTAAVSQGDGIYKDLTARQEVNPGEELVVEVTTIAGSTSAIFFVEVVEYPFQRTSGDATEDRLGNMTEET